MTDDKTLCPHCGVKMLLWEPPIEANWGTHPQYVCFNDECSYYVKGWEWMKKEYDQTVSYRHRYDPETGLAGPLPVWSAIALRNRIVDEDDTENS